MGNPYAPPTSREPGNASASYRQPTRHWFWKLCAIAFATELLVDTVFFIAAGLSFQGVAHQVIHVLASVGVLAYAFSKTYRRAWIWRHIWWAFPVSELIAHLSEQGAIERLTEGRAGVTPMTFVPLTFFLTPFCSLALYRFGRSRLLT